MINFAWFQAIQKLLLVTAPRPKEQGFQGFLCRQIAIPI
jgi:hypothetical protein